MPCHLAKHPFLNRSSALLDSQDSLNGPGRAEWMSAFFGHLRLNLDRDVLGDKRSRLRDAKVGALHGRDGGDTEIRLFADGVRPGIVQLYIERHRLRHAFDGEIACHLPGLFASLLEFRALEGDFWEFFSIE